MSAVQEDAEREAAEIMHAWRADLAARITRARLRFEALGIGREEIIQLAEEWQSYRATEVYLRGELE